MVMFHVLPGIQDIKVFYNSSTKRSLLLYPKLSFNSISLLALLLLILIYFTFTDPHSSLFSPFGVKPGLDITQAYGAGDGDKVDV